MSKKYLIYALKDPNTLQIRYIGRSCSGFKRPREHSCPKNLQKKKTHCVSWIKSLNGKKPLIAVLQYGKNSKHLDILEQKWIREGLNRGWKLTNHTLGGGGAKKYSHTKEARKKISEASKRMWAEGRARVLTKEAKYKCGSSMRGKKLDLKGRNKRAKVQGTIPFQVFDSSGNLVGKWSNKSECARDLKIDRKTINKGLEGILSIKYKYSFQEVK